MICNRPLLHSSLPRFSACSPCSSFLLCLFQIFLTISHSDTPFSPSFSLPRACCYSPSSRCHNKTLIPHIHTCRQMLFLSLQVSSTYFLTCLPYCSSYFQISHVEFFSFAIIYLDIYHSRILFYFVSALYILLVFISPTKTSAFTCLLHKQCFTHDGCLTPPD